MKVKIKISEILSKEVEVEARSESEAEDKIREMYKKEQIVLDWSDFEGEVLFEVAKE